MFRDFCRLSLWNVINVGFIHLFHPGKMLLLLLSAISYMTHLEITDKDPRNTYLYSYFPFISICVFGTVIIRKEFIIDTSLVFTIGELMCLCFCVLHYYNLSLLIPYFDNRRARMMGCPGH